jgi:phosphonate transport system substrate-binding protein
LKFLILALWLVGCSRPQGPLGSENNPIKFYIVPAAEAGGILKNAKRLSDWLHNETGLYFKTAVPLSYVAVVEAIGTYRADVAALSTSSYLIAREKYHVEPIFMTAVQGKSTYKGQIITHVDGLKNLQDIHGKTIAYVDPASASGHLLAVNMFKEKGIVPRQAVFAGGHDAVVTMVYTKKVDAGATYFYEAENGVPRDARRLVKTQFPDVFEKVKILAFTPEIPNDAFVLRKDFPTEIRDKVIKAIEKWARTPEGSTTLKEMTNGTGFIPAVDKDYDNARKLLNMDRAAKK